MKETEIKYLAGLLDADGSMFFNYTSGRVYLSIALDASESVDRNGKYINWLGNQLGVKPYRTDKSKQNKAWAVGNKLVISKKSTINMLVPRLVKYLVIKGKHLQRLYDVYRTLQGKVLEPEELEKLKQFVKRSRKDSGPVKTKSWLPKAYVAGFLDGDGSYIFKKNGGKYQITATSHENDRVVIDLLNKQYGGYITYQDNVVRWHRALGRTSKSFAVPFLKTMHRHSQLKKHKIEMFLHHHSQRLTVSNPTG